MRRRRPHRDRVSEERRLWPSAPFFKIRLNSFKITLAFFLLASVYFMVADRKNYKVTTYVQNIVVDTFSPLLVLSEQLKSSVLDTIDDIQSKKTDMQLKLEAREDHIHYLELEIRKLQKNIQGLHEELEYKKSMKVRGSMAKLMIPYPNEPLNLFIDVGENQGITDTSVVVTAKGLVGRVIHLGNNYSQVLSLLDQRTHLPVYFLKSGTEAILKGGIGPALSVEYAEDGVVQENDIAYTSGKSGLYPPNIPVGIVRIDNNKEVFVVPFQKRRGLQNVFLVESPLSKKDL